MTFTANEICIGIGLALGIIAAVPVAWAIVRAMTSTPASKARLASAKEKMEGNHENHR